MGMISLCRSVKTRQFGFDPSSTCRVFGKGPKNFHGFLHFKEEGSVLSAFLLIHARFPPIRSRSIGSLVLFPIDPNYG